MKLVHFKYVNYYQFPQNELGNLSVSYSSLIFTLTSVCVESSSNTLFALSNSPSCDSPVNDLIYIPLLNYIEKLTIELSKRITRLRSRLTTLKSFTPYPFIILQYSLLHTL